MKPCEYCNERHGIYEDWAKCNEQRLFEKTLDNWARDMVDHDAEVRARLDKYVRMV